MNLYNVAISGLCIFVAGILSAIFVLAKDYRNPLNQIWSVFSSTVSLWGGGFALMCISSTYHDALIFSRFHNLIAIFIPIFFLHFTYTFLETILEKRWVLISGYIVTITYFLVCVFNIKAFLPSVSLKIPNYYYTDGGLLYYFFPVFFTVIVILGIVDLYKELSVATGTKQIQLRFVFWGFLFGFPAGGTAFFYVFNIPIYPVGTWGVLSYIACTTYAITKHELMDIRLAITKTGAIICTMAMVIVSGLSLLLFWGNTIGLIALSILLMMMWAMVGNWTQRFIQTGMEEKFISGTLNLDEVVKIISVKLIKINTRGEILDLLPEALMRQFHAAFAYGFLAQDSHWQGQFVTHRTNRSVEILNDHDLVKTARETTGPGRLEKPIQMVQTDTEFLKIPDLSETLVIPIEANDKMEGIVILGPKVSEDRYTNSDLSIIEAIINQAQVVVERIIKDEQLKFVNRTLAEKVQEQVAELERNREFLEKASDQMALVTFAKGIAHGITTFSIQLVFISTLCRRIVYKIRKLRKNEPLPVLVS